MKDEKITLDQNYLAFFEEVKRHIQSTRIRITRIANREVFQLYWWLGEQIIEQQTRFGWGKGVVVRLSKDLKNLFPSSRGFSTQNLWYMRQTYLEYKEHSNLQQLVGEVPWGHNILLLSKIKSLSVREYYLKGIQQMGWTRDVLLFQIKSQAYERHAIADKQHNFEETLPTYLAEQADKALKDIYLFDTLGITKPVIEAELEQRMVSKIKNVMLELGYGFAFIGNQFRIAREGKEYFIDLLFYNRRLQALIAMELKASAFKPEYAGKMNFYLNLLDDFVREPHENPSIGIILCGERDHFEVEYALRNINRPVGVSEFQLTRELPDQLNHLLPDPREIEAEIKRELGDEEWYEPSKSVKTRKKRTIKINE